ncbi:hypothetical protein [Corallincola luteus]|uniref:hypothetical protein n=1 Tax=Corallincola luteus TaxID=1775177 RepID=UPI00103B2223|nr:hypothetical protein [Corallincola luteus]
MSTKDVAVASFYQRLPFLLFVVVLSLSSGLGICTELAGDPLSNLVTQFQAIQGKDFPCQWRSKGPYNGPYVMVECQPIKVDIEWEVAEKHEGPDFTDKMFWHIKERGIGELHIFQAKPDCKITSKSCVEIFRAVVPGFSAIRPESRQTKIVRNYAQFWRRQDDGDEFYPYFDSWRHANFKAKTYWQSAWFFLEAKRGSTVHSDSHINSPQLQWFQHGDFSGANNIGQLDLVNGARANEELSDGLSMVDLAPTYEEFFSLLQGKKIEKNFRIDFSSDWAYGEAHKRHVQGDLSYTLSATRPGMLVVSPTGSFEAFRNTSKKSFAPRQKSYQIKNEGEQELSFSIAADQPWVGVQPNKGKLAPDETLDIQLSLRPEADKLPAGKHQAQVMFENSLSHLGDGFRLVVLKERQRWRLVIEQKNDLVFGDSYLFGGIATKVNTEIDFEIEDGKFKNGSGRAFFVSHQSIAHPKGGFNCSVKKDQIYTPRFDVSGSVSGGFVSLSLPSKNMGYEVQFTCDANPKPLKAYFYSFYQKANPKALKKGQKIADWPKKIREYVESEAATIRTNAHLTFNQALYQFQKSSWNTMPLKHLYSHQEGTPASVDYDKLVLYEQDR